MHSLNFKFNNAAVGGLLLLAFRQKMGLLQPPFNQTTLKKKIYYCKKLEISFPVSF